MFHIKQPRDYPYYHANIKVMLFCACWMDLLGSYLRGKEKNCKYFFGSFEMIRTRFQQLISFHAPILICIVKAVVIWFLCFLDIE